MNTYPNWIDTAALRAAFDKGARIPRGPPGSHDDLARLTGEQDMITINFSNEPKPFFDAEFSMTAANKRQAEAILWALAKQSQPQYASCMFPMALERIDNAWMRNAEPPAELSLEVKALVAQFEKRHLTAKQIAAASDAEDVIVEALNTAYDKLGELIGSHPDFVWIVEKTAREWAQECLNCAEEATQDYFDRYMAGDR